MRVLIGCELSGTIRDAFAARGHYAVSCDLEPSDAPGLHYQGDLFDVLRPEYQWDLVIAHPPCTFLSSSGLHWNTRIEGIRINRQQKTYDAIAFAERIWSCRSFVPKMVIENPIGCLSTRSQLGREILGKTSQFIQPYEFGHDASKRTSLWLQGVAALQLDPLKRYPGRMVEWKGKMVERWSNQTDSGQSALPPSDDRAKVRSNTYQGWADAMATQWG
jgi:hypothetical protein